MVAVAKIESSPLALLLPVTTNSVPSVAPPLPPCPPFWGFFVGETIMLVGPLITMGFSLHV